MPIKIYYNENEKFKKEKILKTHAVDKGMISKMYSKCLRWEKNTAVEKWAEDLSGR